jgi:hypothetical protein
MTHDHIGTEPQHGISDGEAAAICRTVEQGNGYPANLDDLYIMKEKADEDTEIAHNITMPFAFNDGGRSAAGYKGLTDDCACRAIAIATRLPYQEVYDALNEAAKTERITKRQRKKSNARTGVRKKACRKYLGSLGWRWVPTMFIGQGCSVHLRADELPTGRLVVQVSKHLVAVVDRVIHDTHDCSRSGTRCVYGYYLNLDEVGDRHHG